MALHAMAARRAVARATGDAAGVRVADGAMVGRGVTSPARWSALVVGDDRIGGDGEGERSDG